MKALLDKLDDGVFDMLALFVVLGMLFSIGYMIGAIIKYLMACG